MQNIAMKKEKNTIGTTNSKEGRYIVMEDSNIIEPKKAKNTLLVITSHITPNTYYKIVLDVCGLVRTVQ